MIQVPKHADLIFICISCYIYAYQLRCTKQVVLRALKKVFLLPPSLQNQPSMAVCNSAGIHAVCGCTINRALRTTKLLPKVVICINITCHTLQALANVLPSQSQIKETSAHSHGRGHKILIIFTDIPSYAFHVTYGIRPYLLMHIHFRTATVE